MNKLKKCKKCLANYKGKHECFGLMKLLVDNYKKKNKQK